MRQSQHIHDDPLIAAGITAGDSCGRRYLAVLDVLGAKSLNDLHDVEYTALIMKELRWQVALFARNADHNPESTSPVKFVMYADSILLYSERPAPDGLRDVIKQTGQLIGFAMARGIPLRGAITAGDLYVSHDSQIMTGPGIVCAHELERKQKWAGAIIDPALTKGTHEESIALDYALWAHWTKPYEVPFEGRRETHLTVDWCGSTGGQDSDGFRRRLQGTVGRTKQDGVAKQEAALAFWRDATDTQEVFCMREAARARVEQYYRKTGEWQRFSPAYQQLLSAPTAFQTVNGVRGPLPTVRN